MGGSRGAGMGRGKKLCRWALATSILLYKERFPLVLPTFKPTNQKHNSDGVLEHPRIQEKEWEEKWIFRAFICTSQKTPPPSLPPLFCNVKWCHSHWDNDNPTGDQYAILTWLILISLSACRTKIRTNLHSHGTACNTFSMLLGIPQLPCNMPPVSRA